MDKVEDFIAHFGVKGMRWGVRKKSGGASSQPSSAEPDAPNAPSSSGKKEPGSPIKVKIEPGKKIKTSGGKGYLPTEDAIKAAALRQKAKKSGVNSLTSKELSDLINRMTTEQKYQAAYKAYKKANQGLIKGFIAEQGKDMAMKQVKTHGKEIKDLILEGKKFDVDLSKIKISSLS